MYHLVVSRSVTLKVTWVVWCICNLFVSGCFVLLQNLTAIILHVTLMWTLVCLGYLLFTPILSFFSFFRLMVWSSFVVNLSNSLSVSLCVYVSTQHCYGDLLLSSFILQSGFASCLVDRKWDDVCKWIVFVKQSIAGIDHYYSIWTSGFFLVSSACYKESGSYGLVEDWSMFLKQRVNDEVGFLFLI